MKFTFNKASSADIPDIVRLMEDASRSLENTGWFVADDESYIAGHIAEKGFIITAKTERGEMSGFFIIDMPGAADKNLGHFLNLSEKELMLVAHMDSVVVSYAFRGHKLQRRMLEAAEKELSDTSYTYLLATVHPDNRYSLNSMLSLGYQIIGTYPCYGGLTRHVLLKRIPVYTRNGK